MTKVTRTISARTISHEVACALSRLRVIVLGNRVPAVLARCSTIDRQPSPWEKMQKCNRMQSVGEGFGAQLMASRTEIRAREIESNSVMELNSWRSLRDFIGRQSGLKITIRNLRHSWLYGKTSLIYWVTRNVRVVYWNGHQHSII